MKLHPTMAAPGLSLTPPLTICGMRWLSCPQTRLLRPRMEKRPGSFLAGPPFFTMRASVRQGSLRVGGLVALDLAAVEIHFDAATHGYRHVEMLGDILIAPLQHDRVDARRQVGCGVAAG